MILLRSLRELRRTGPPAFDSRGLSRGLLLALLVGALACGEAELPEPEARVVVWLDGESQSLADLQRYLDANLLVAESEQIGEGEQQWRVKSRLFDAFLDERLLLAEARRRGFAVSDIEVEDHLGLLQDEVVTGPGWDQARRRLLVRKLEAAVAAQLRPVTDDEARRHLESLREAAGEDRRVRLRGLMLESVEEAERVYGEIRRRRITFNEAVVQHETATGQGVSLELSWNDLWEEQRAALQKLRPGQVSRPVSRDGQTYLFQLEAWVEPETEVDPAVLESARLDLQRRRGQLVFRDLLAELRETSEIRINPENLPFRYLPDDSAH